MAEFIEREKALAFQNELEPLLCRNVVTHDIMSATKDADLVKYLQSIPAADVVSRGAYDQTDWERCVALTQLKEIGKGLGERMDDVRSVVLCRDCKQYMGRPWENNESGICARTDCGVGEDDFCSYGEKLEKS